MAVTFKLPPEVVAAHRAALESWPWGKTPEADLPGLIPGAGFVEGDKLEAIVRLGRTVIRAKNVGAITRMRAYADTLPQMPKPTAEDIAAVLAARNPPEDDL